MPKYTKKTTIWYLVILVRTTKKSIQSINKPVFLFWFFSCCCFGFISKAATTKNRQFVSDFSMICMFGPWIKYTKSLSKFFDILFHYWVLKNQKNFQNLENLIFFFNQKLNFLPLKQSCVNIWKMISRSFDVISIRLILLYLWLTKKSKIKPRALTATYDKFNPGRGYLY
jgi:hypothetical protein